MQYIKGIMETSSCNDLVILRWKIHKLEMHGITPDMLICIQVMPGQGLFADGIAHKVVITTTTTTSSS